MASPTFNSQTLFDSGDGTTNYSEGVLFVGPYSKIRQKLHFNGEDGDRYLTHGFSDRTWTFRGLMSAPTIAGLLANFAAIEAYIDEADSDNSTYHALTDSFGQSFTAAQIHNFQYEPPHYAVNRRGIGEYVAQVTVTGVIQGMEVDG